MKKSVFISAILASGILFFGCASNKVQNLEPVTDSQEEITEPEEIQQPEIIRFVDWQYKGFGKELPTWLDSAFDNDLNGIKTQIPELNTNEIIILTACASNLDQAEAIMNNNIKNGINVNGDIYTLCERSWVQLSEEFIQQENSPYCAIAIFYFNDEGL